MLNNWLLCVFFPFEIEFEETLQKNLLHGKVSKHISRPMFYISKHAQIMVMYHVYYVRTITRPAADSKERPNFATFLNQKNSTTQPAKKQNKIRTWQTTYLQYEDI